MNASAPSPRVPTGIPVDAWPWEALVHDLWPRLLAAGRERFGLTREECEDAIQTVALELVTRRSRAETPAAYVTQAFHRACCDRLTARRNAPLSALEDVSVPAIDRRAALDAACDIRSALERISPRCRDLIVAREFEGRTLPDAADAARLSRLNVWHRLDACLRKLRALCLRPTRTRSRS